MSAVAPAHQHAILGVAQVCYPDGKPYAESDKRGRERKRRSIRKHAMAKIVGLGLPVRVT